MTETPGKVTTATLKASGQRDNAGPWIVLNGWPSEVREQVIEVMGLDAEAVAHYSTAELVIEASLQFEALYSAAKSLGARPLAAGADTPAAPVGPTGQSAWAAASTPEPAAAKDPLIAALEAANTVVEIGDLWRLNKSEFERPEVAAAAAAARKRIDEASA